MKRYIYSISGLILAFVFSAFTTPKTKTALKFRLKNSFLGSAASYDLPNGIIDNPANWVFTSSYSCSGGQWACSFTIDDVIDQDWYHDDGFGVPALNTASDVEGPNVPGTDDLDGDGVRDGQMFITTTNGTSAVPGSSPTRYYQILDNSFYIWNAAQRPIP
jgi:hypothetical protein